MHFPHSGAVHVELKKVDELGTTELLAPVVWLTRETQSNELIGAKRIGRIH